jgi:hypothetical protein
MKDSEEITVQFSPRPRGLRNICDNCAFSCFTQSVASMMAATGLHCSDVVPGPLGELIQWAAATSATDVDVDDGFDEEELNEVIEDVQMDGRQSLCHNSVETILHRMAVDDLYTVTQEWFALTIMIMPVNADSEALSTVAAICYDSSEGFANHVVAFVRRHGSWWKIDDDIVTFLGEREPAQIVLSRIQFKV